MNIYLDRVLEKDKDVLFRLLQYSLFEESIYDLNEIGDDGLFNYKYFDLYFTNDDRDAFFIRELDSNKLLGFVMINCHVVKNDSGHSIAEFMIVPKYRNKKIGKTAAFMAFDLYNGIWEVSPSYGSSSAYNFWNNVITSYTNSFEFNDNIFIFNKEN